MDAVSGADRVPVGQEQRVALVVRARAAHLFEHQLSRSEVPFDTSTSKPICTYHVGLHGCMILLSLAR